MLRTLSASLHKHFVPYPAQERPGLHNPWGELAVLGLVALMLAYFSRFVVHFYDDAFITFRISRNLAEGNGLFYNVGSGVMVQTSTAYATINALWFKIFGDRAPWVIVRIDLLYHLISCFMIMRLARAGVGQAVPPVLFYGIMALMLGLGTFQLVPELFCAMESMFYTMLVATGIYLVQRGRREGLLLCAALALTRPEGILLPGLAACWLWLHNPRAFMQSWPWALALLVLGFGSIYAYFGVIVPQSVAAKSQLSPAIDMWGNVQLVLAHATRLVPGVVLFPLAGLGAVVVARQWRTGASTLLLVWMVIYILLYTFLVAWRFAWYEIHLRYAIYIFASFGLLYLAGRLVQVWPAMAVPRWQAGLVGLGLAGGAWLFVASPFNYHVSYTVTSYADYQAHLRQVGLALDQAPPIKGTVSIEPLGIVGYYAPHKTFLDFPGLTSPKVLAVQKRLGRKLLDLSPGKDPAAFKNFIDGIDPDLLVLRRIEYNSLLPLGLLQRYKVYTYIPYTGTDSDLQMMIGFYILQKK